MTLFTTNIPIDHEALRQSIYQGHIFKAPPTATSTLLIECIKEILYRHLGEDLEHIHEIMNNEAFFPILSDIRQDIAKSDYYKKQMQKIIKDFGFEDDKNAIDSLRLRAVAPKLHENPTAKAAYYPHRDTWYANPMCQVNWWIPLFNTPKNRSFSFYPDYFDKKIENTSSTFDYDYLVKKVGWQGAKKGATANTTSDNSKAPIYPTIETKIPKNHATAFSAKAGEIILFSASHLHATNKNNSGKTRFSLDFRTVHLKDHQNGFGAPNLDNASSPDALKDYTHPDNIKAIKIEVKNRDERQ